MAAVEVRGRSGVAAGGEVADVGMAGPGPARIFYLDRLKLILVALIIFGHGVLAYGDHENAWPYRR